MIENEIFPWFALLSFILVLIPFPWHLHAWNAGTCLYMFWTALASLVMFINSIIWKDNAINWAPVWCDLSSRVYILAHVGIPTASLCINRRLYNIATVKAVTSTIAMRRRALIIDLSIGLGIPIIELILQYFCQGHRFDIFEYIGCFPHTYNTPLAYVFVYSWPVVIGLVSGVYCCLTINALWNQRARLKELLSTNSGLSTSRYFRLMALATIELLGTVPLGAWGIYTDAAYINPYLGFADTHYNFSRVEQYPALLWMNWGLYSVALRMTRWSIVACGLIFFAFFGFAEEARRHYRLAFKFVAKSLGFSTGTVSTSKTTSSFGNDRLSQMALRDRTTFPSFARTSPTLKRDSVQSSSSLFKTARNSIATITDAVDPQKKDEDNPPALSIVIPQSPGEESILSSPTLHSASGAIDSLDPLADQSHTLPNESHDGDEESSPSTPRPASPEDTPSTPMGPRRELDSDVDLPPQTVASPPTDAVVAATADIV